MVRIVNQNLMKDHEDLTPAQRKAAQKAMNKARQANPLRRIRVACCADMRRDSVALLGERVWCDTHADWTKVVFVDE